MSNELFVEKKIYTVLRRVYVSTVLSDIASYRNFWFVDGNGDDPAPIIRCRSYLENLNPRKKIYILDHAGEEMRFEDA